MAQYILLEKLGQCTFYFLSILLTQQDIGQIPSMLCPIPDFIGTEEKKKKTLLKKRTVDGSADTATGRKWLVLQDTIHRASQTVGFVIFHFIIPTKSTGCCNLSCGCCRVKKAKEKKKSGTAEAIGGAVNIHSGAV